MRDSRAFPSLLFANLRHSSQVLTNFLVFLFQLRAKCPSCCRVDATDTDARLEPSTLGLIRDQAWPFRRKGQRRCCRASCSLGVVSPLCASFLWKKKGKKKGIDDEIGEEISFSLGLRGVALAVVVSQSSATAAECVRAGLNTDVHWSQRCSG